MLHKHKSLLLPRILKVKNIEYRGELKDNLTIFLQERVGNKITGLLIHDIKNPKSPQTYIAENGEFVDEDNKKILRLFNGNIQIFDRNEKKISEVEFQTYDLNLAPYNKQESEHIYPDELYTYQIIRNNNNLDMYILAIFNCTIYILF